MASQAQTPTDVQATITFDKPEHDFGKIKEGTLATHEFTFTNTGKAPLVLSNVQPSCGCTTPEWSKEPIMPGGKGTVKAVFNSYRTTWNISKIHYRKIQFSRRRRDTYV